MSAKNSEVVEIAKELVNIESDSLKDGEKEVARYISDYLDGLEIDSQVFEFAPGRANVVAKIGKGQGLMLNGHIDTVPIGDLSLWKHGPGAIVKEGKLYGRGSADMKGGVAAILSSLKGIDFSKTKRSLLLVFVADEEVEGKGSNWLLSKKKELFGDVKYGIIAEPTNMKVQIAQKGALHLKVNVKGKSAHGSRPWEGENAIVGASKFISMLDELSKNLKKQDKLMGKGTFNVGMISGGVATNVVPESCTISIDRRIVPEESVDEAISQIKNLLAKLKVKHSLEVKFAKGSYSLPKESYIAKQVKDVSGSDYTWSTGYTEAELYKNKGGIDSVVYGPGSLEVIHKPNEHVSIKDLEKSAAVYRKVVERWL